MASVPSLTPISPHAFPSLLHVRPALVALSQNLPDAAAVCLLCYSVVSQFKTSKLQISQQNTTDSILGSN